MPPDFSYTYGFVQVCDLFLLHLHMTVRL